MASKKDEIKGMSAKDYDINTKADPAWGGLSDGDVGKRFPPPPVPSTEDGSGAGTRVSTEALKEFATNIRSLIPPLKDVLHKIRETKLAPGVFFDAFELVKKVTGSKTGDSSGGVTSIQHATEKFTINAINAITQAAEELEKLATAYATTEELNSATGKDLSEHIENARQRIISMVGGAGAVGGGGLGGIGDGAKGGGGEDSRTK
ncbi:hypothetical protein [Crossiella sp. CA198]|uniref:hypothetical protein n=1 Tax=Crossiella sp. CA198 TaxID=3455607 RepID=UPI003F8D1104